MSELPKEYHDIATAKGFVHKVSSKEDQNISDSWWPDQEGKVRLRATRCDQLSTAIPSYHPDLQGGHPMEGSTSVEPFFILAFSY